MLNKTQLNINQTIKNLSRHKVDLYFGHESSESLRIEKKSDQSLVTDFDISISNEVKRWKDSVEEFRDWNFFSEEDHQDLVFPAIILDPIDGTRELVKGRDECVVSLAFMEHDLLTDNSNHYAFIYNPFSGYENHTGSSNSKVLSKSNQPMLGLISRSEWHEGIASEVVLNPAEIILAPRGSIAFKLSLLASGTCDFVASFKNKSLWDIAAGTLLLQERGYRFYEQGKLVTSLNKKFYHPPLVWVHPLQEERLFHNLKWNR